MPVLFRFGLFLRRFHRIFLECANQKVLPFLERSLRPDIVYCGLLFNINAKSSGVENTSRRRNSRRVVGPHHIPSQWRFRRSGFVPTSSYYFLATKSLGAVIPYEHFYTIPQQGKQLLTNCLQVVPLFDLLGSGYVRQISMQILFREHCVYPQGSVFLYSGHCDVFIFCCTYFLVFMRHCRESYRCWHSRRSHSGR